MQQQLLHDLIVWGVIFSHWINLKSKTPTARGAGVWFDKSKKSWKIGSGDGCPAYTQSSCAEERRPQQKNEPFNSLNVNEKRRLFGVNWLILEDLQTLHIPTNKKLEVWTQYRILFSFFGGYFSSFKKILRQREICKKSWEITGMEGLVCYITVKANSFMTHLGFEYLHFLKKSHRKGWQVHTGG